MRIFLLFVCMWAVCARSQDDPEMRRRVRSEKIEAILRTQDLRTLHTGKLVSLLSDDDAAVRCRALRAYGSIQDTSVLPLLVQGLTDPVHDVETAAAFAIGQTGTHLSPAGRAHLEHDLLWNRLGTTLAVDDLIEQIGNFGTKEGLQDLIIRVGNAYPRQHIDALVMAIARFGIRGITDPGAVRYLLSEIRNPDVQTWHIVYALQRIGDNPETRPELERLATLRQDPDPLVRLQLALLLGKVRELNTGKDPLQRMASTDGDWRVRVAALRSLAAYPLASDPTSLDIFRRAMYDGNMHVALSAIAALRSSDLAPRDTTGPAQEIFRGLTSIAANQGNGFVWQLQGESARTLGTILREDAYARIGRASWPNENLRADFLLAFGATGALQAEPALLDGVADQNPIVVCAALDGLADLARLHPENRELSSTVCNVLSSALARGDVAVVATAASMMADSLFRRDQSTADLLHILPRLRVPDDIEALQEVLSALGVLGDGRAVPALVGMLGQPDRSVALEAAHALRQITGNDYTRQIPDGDPLYTDMDFAYLRTLPDTIHVTIATSRGDIQADFYKDLAPFTIMSMLKLAGQRGFYRGLAFHRVVPNFVIQGGCPRGDGWGGPGYTIRSEFSSEHYLTGTVGIASAGKDTEGSQFFITHSPQPHLDGKYTVVGRVIHGQDVVDAIQRDDRLFDIRIR